MFLRSKMELVELIVEVIVDGLITYPGAAIRWTIFRKKPFKKYLQDGWFINVFPLIILIATIVLIVNLI